MAVQTMVALPASAMSPSCISVRPAATLSPHCDTESALRPPAWVSAAFAPAHRSNPTTPTAGSRSHAIHRSPTTRGMPIAEAWIGADRFVRLRKDPWVPFGSLDAACDVGAANLGAIRDTPRRPQPSHGVRSPATALPALRA